MPIIYMIIIENLINYCRILKIKNKKQKLDI